MAKSFDLCNPTTRQRDGGWKCGAWRVAVEKSGLGEVGSLGFDAAFNPFIPFKRGTERAGRKLFPSAI